MTKTAIAAAAALLCLNAHALRTTTEGGTEIDFNSTISLGVQVRLGKPMRDTIGNDNGGNVPTGARLGAQCLAGQRSGLHRAAGEAFDAVTAAAQEQPAVRPWIAVDSNIDGKRFAVAPPQGVEMLARRQAGRARCRQEFAARLFI